MRPLQLASTLVLLGTGAALAQNPAPASSIGSVEVSAASLSGMLTLAGGRALIGSNAVVTARDRTATIQLSRGGEILVCTTSVLHAARAETRAEPAPLLLALDHGAVEIHMGASTHDSILTPDLRFSIHPPAGQSSLAGVLDLRLRVAGNGDTCVDNRGDHAPTLDVAEQFGSGLYQIRPGQHILFEHGSVREVVDNESSPCGCPPPPVLSAATHGISTDATRAARPGAAVADDPDEVRPHTAAAQAHPFPTAESQGLAPTQDAAATVPQASPNEPHAQVAATLAFSPTAGFDGSDSVPSTPGNTSPAAPASPATSGNSPSPNSPSSAPAQPSAASSAGPSSTPRPATPSAASTTSKPPTPAPAPKALASASPSPMQDASTVHETAAAPLPPPAPPAGSVLHSIGRFFRRLFGGDSSARPTARPASPPPPAAAASAGP